MNRRKSFAAWCFASLLALWSAQANALVVFTAHLTGSQEVPSNASTATGSATLVLNDAMTALTYDITIFGLDFTGLQTPGTVLDNLVNAHIHAAAPPGVNAPVVFGFIGAPFNDNNPNDVVVTPFAMGVGGTISGKWDALEGNNTTLATQLPNLLAGNAYLNFHTAGFPGGEIRGQILVPEPASALLLGAALLAFGAARRRRLG